MIQADLITYLKSLKSVRDRCSLVYDLSKKNALNHFEVDEGNLDKVVAFIQDLIKRDYKSLDEIPPHSRWRHFNYKGIKRLDPLLNSSKFKTKMETAKAFIDLFVISVLLDAGAGAKWKFVEKATGMEISRSEGLAVASLEMFEQGLFSDDSSCLCANAKGLQKLQLEDLKKGFQIDSKNEMAGLEGRFELLKRLGVVMESKPEFFGASNARPGNLIDYLKADENGHVHIEKLWKVVMEGFSAVWPATRTNINGIPMGDAWPLKCLSDAYPNETNIVPFHKLSQWLTYSLMEPLETILGLKFQGVELLTGLPEYRNGGLLIDFEVLKLKDASLKGKKFAPSDDLIVEWRALTVILLDKTAERLRKVLNLNATQLPLAKVLEAGTWKAGREIAAKLRPDTQNPPIEIISDGTVF